MKSMQIEDAMQKHTSTYIVSMNSSKKLQLDIILFLTANECLQIDSYVECKLQFSVTCSKCRSRKAEKNRDPSNLGIFSNVFAEPLKAQQSSLLLSFSLVKYAAMRRNAET